MDTPSTGEVDLHRLDLRFADARMLEPRAVEQLTRSIEHSGQLIPCIAVAEDGQLVLVDGYRRVLALRRLGRDTASVESWGCDLAQGLLKVLARVHGRPFAAIEEALLVRELIQRHGLSQHEVARRSGHDVSWVSRRLELVCGMPDALLASVRKGELSAWAAIRVMAPLARANSAHAKQLLDALGQTPLSTREMQVWFQHYQTSPRAAREHMVEHPRLFIEALHTRDEAQADARLREGPEGQCTAEIGQLIAIIKRLRQRLPTLNPEPLLSALTRLRHAIDALQSDLARYCHDPNPDSRCGPNPASPGLELARDQP
jgi:ParB-like chromosome segregation protein Spo0J